MTTEFCRLLWKLTLIKAEWLWKKMYQDLCDMAKKTVKQVACMRFYFTSKALYLEVDASGIGLRDRLLQVGEGMNCGHVVVPDNAALHQTSFICRILSSAELWYNNTRC